MTATSSEATRPCDPTSGTNDYFGLFQRPESAFRTTRKGSRSFTSIDDAIIDDDRLSMESPAIMFFLLRLPDDWEHSHLVQQLCRKFRRSDPTIRKYVEELARCGYLHRFLVPAGCRGGEMKWKKVYKISEVSMPRPEGYAWDQWIPLGGRHAGQVQTQASLPGHRRKTFGLLKAGPSKPSKILVPYKGERRRVLRSSELYLKKNPLPLLPKGDDSFEFDRVVSEKAQPVSRTPRQTSPRAVARKTKNSTPVNQAAPRVNPADFNTSRRSAVVPADGFAGFMVDFRAAYPEAVAALQRAGRPGSSAWIEAMLANPLVAMLQKVLGYRHWDLHSLLKQARRLRRGALQPYEVVLLWCAKQAGSSERLVRDAKTLLEGSHFRKAVLDGCTWDERLRYIRKSFTDEVLSPLVREASRMVTFASECPCSSVTDEGRPVREQAAIWLANGDAEFFTQPDAVEWFRWALAGNPEFFAGYREFITERDLPTHLLAELDTVVAGVTPAALDAWRESVILSIPLVPGGLHKHLVDYTGSHRFHSPLAATHPILRALSGALPDCGGWLPDHHRLLDLAGEEIDF